MLVVALILPQLLRIDLLASVIVSSALSVSSIGLKQNNQHMHGSIEKVI